LKLLAVSNWYLPTTLAILKDGDTNRVLLGSVILVLPSVAVLLVAAAWTDIPRWIEANYYVRVLAAFTLSALGVVGFLLMSSQSWPHLATAVGAVAVLFVRSRVLKRRKMIRERTVGTTQPRVAGEGNRVSPFEARAAFVGVSLFFMWATLAVPWLPVEAVSVSGADAFAGHIIAEDSRVTIVLEKSDRTLTRYDTDQVVHWLCTETDWASLSVRDAIAGPLYPSCPD
jgi:hypothetical protein